MISLKSAAEKRIEVNADVNATQSDQKDNTTMNTNYDNTYGKYNNIYLEMKYLLGGNINEFPNNNSDQPAWKKKVY